MGPAHPPMLSPCALGTVGDVTHPSAVRVSAKTIAFLRSNVDGLRPRSGRRRRSGGCRGRISLLEFMVVQPAHPPRLSPPSLGTVRDTAESISVLIPSDGIARGIARGGRRRRTGIGTALGRRLFVIVFILVLLLLLLSHLLILPLFCTVVLVHAHRRRGGSSCGRPSSVGRAGGRIGTRFGRRRHLALVVTVAVAVAVAVVGVVGVIVTIVAVVAAGVRYRHLHVQSIAIASPPSCNSGRCPELRRMGFITSLLSVVIAATVLGRSVVHVHRCSAGGGGTRILSCR
mmetsp:Transcript_15345/g.44400  ORF Transcript_15345/g.44400 Transcript_15345/m.44400 type:complete len:287 (-) Transcript_15345:172-1032(-)